MTEKFIYFPGTSSSPGLIPRTLDVLFESLKENLEPEKFNEISSLNDTELKNELNHKEQLLKMSNFKVIEYFLLFFALNL